MGRAARLIPDAHHRALERLYASAPINHAFASVLTVVEAERARGKITDERKQRLFRIELDMRAHGRGVEKGR